MMWHNPAIDTDECQMPRKDEQRQVGRPTENNRPTRKIYVTLDEETIEKARRIGSGNVSSGIRICIAAKRSVSKQ